ENTFSCAFSRTEQVLNTMTSASSAFAAGARPSAAASTSEIFSESYSFIWQPKVRLKSLPAMIVTCALLLRVGLRGFLLREDPDAPYPPLHVGHELDEGSGGQGGGQDDPVFDIADLRARREFRAVAVEIDRH